MPAKVLTGKIVSNKMNGTVVVAVEFPKRHPMYDKTVKNTRRFKAKDSVGLPLGSTVLIQEGRHYSKDCTWNIIKVLGSKES